MARNKENHIGVMDNIDFDVNISNEGSSAGRNINPKSLENLKPREAGTAKPKAFMQLNIYEYEDYIYRMSKVQGKTMSGYVLDLIKADMDNNASAYQGLKQIKALDKPARVAKHTK